MIEMKRKDGETPSALFFRFSKKVRQSGILKEVRKRRFHSRPLNRRKVALSAKHRNEKAEEIKEMKKMGLL